MTEVNTNQRVFTDEEVDAVVRELEKTSDRDKRSIIGGGPFSTVNELIQGIRNRTPDGMRLVGYYYSARERVDQISDERRGSLLTRLRAIRVAALLARIRKALEK
jgi:hypothetical protein